MGQYKKGVYISKKMLAFLIALILVIIGIVISYALGYDWVKVFTRQLLGSISVVSK